MRNKKINQISTVLSILKEGTAFLNQDFFKNPNPIQLEYCENLYHLEKMINKMNQ